MNEIDEIKIYKLQESTEENLDAIRSLTKQLGDNSSFLSDSEFREVLVNPSLTLFVAGYLPNQLIIGMVTLIIHRIPFVKKAYMEDLVVDGSYRHHGIGTKLINEVMKEAREKGVKYLDFTSTPKRVSNKLYEKLGFKKRDTNVYRYVFDYS